MKKVHTVQTKRMKLRDLVQLVNPALLQKIPDGLQPTQIPMQNAMGWWVWVHPAHATTEEVALLPGVRAPRGYKKPKLLEVGEEALWIWEK